MKGEIDVLGRLRRFESHMLPIVGCWRRNTAESSFGTNFRFTRGNILLDAVCNESYTITELAGKRIPPTQLWLADAEGGQWVLAFRGGWWKQWWIEDFALLFGVAAIRMQQGQQPLLGVLVLQELDGDLRSHYLTPENLIVHGTSPEEYAEMAIREWSSDSQRRIPKNGARAAGLCPGCPIKKDCDLRDNLDGDTHDWPSHYIPG